MRSVTVFVGLRGAALVATLLAAGASRADEPRPPVPVAPAAANAVAPPDPVGGPAGPPDRDRTWLFGLELGEAATRLHLADGETGSFGELNRSNWPDRRSASDFTLALRAGASLSARLLAGASVTVTNSVIGSLADEYSFVGLTTYGAWAAWLPIGDGFLVRGGAGAAQLRRSLLVTSTGVDEADSVLGLNLTGGAGYALWLGRSFNLTLNLDYAVQRYRFGARRDTGGTFHDPVWSQLVSARIGLDFYGRRAPRGAVEPLFPAGPPARVRSDWYLTFELGWGGGTAFLSSRSLDFVFVPEGIVPQALALQVGRVVGRRVLVGGEVSFNYGAHDVGVVGGASSTTDRTDRDWIVLQALGTATVFPVWERHPDAGDRELAPSGWYVRGGLGLASLTSAPDRDSAAPGERNWSRSGPSAAAGTGWAFDVGRSRTRTLNVGFDWGWQWYGESADEPQRSTTYSLHGAMAFF